MYELTKSKYCRGLQCPKILWLDEHHPEFGENIANKSVLDNGTKVGELARLYFGNCELVGFDANKNEMVDRTKKLMETADNIAEASFCYESLFCSIDILHRNDDGWDLVEVKSSTEVSEIYLEDVAFQYYVLTMCEVPVKGVYILYIDNTYVRGEQLDLKGLFVLEECTDMALRKFYEIKSDGRLNLMMEYVKSPVEPEKDIDLCCDKPYPCAYKKYCGKHIPEYSVFNLARMQAKKKYELYHAGIVSYQDVLSSGAKINANQRR